PGRYPVSRAMIRAHERPSLQSRYTAPPRDRGLRASAPGRSLATPCGANRTLRLLAEGDQFQHLPNPLVGSLLQVLPEQGAVDIASVMLNQSIEVARLAQAKLEGVTG